MNKTEFTLLLREPCSITPNQVNIVEEIIETYPYFQAAHVLNLKGLKKQNSYKYNQALKTTAAYTTNRTILFDFITSDALNLEKKEAIEFKELTENEIVDLEIVESSISTEESIDLIEKPILESLRIGEPLDFDKNEKHSFNEWLQLTSLIPIERDTDQTKKNPTKESKNFKLIDEFLDAKPKLKPNKSIDLIDISYESISENESLMTETLARVYLEQKKYAKAIKAFKILSLKYPEKSGFFADRIKAVQFLQKNNS